MEFDFHGFVGVDISTHQDSPYIPGNNDFNQMKAAGVHFLVIRASNGLTKDADFDLNWENSKGLFPVSPYHYYNNTKNPYEQARFYWSVIKDKIDDKCMVWVDIEDRQSGYLGWKHWYNFIAELKRVSGLPSSRIGIYTGYYYWTEFTQTATTTELNWFVQFALWLAWYIPNPLESDPVKLQEQYSIIKSPKPWVTCKILQVGTPVIGNRLGVESEEIDWNHFNGTKEDFDNFFGGHATEPEPPPTGETMDKGTVTTASLKIRTGPGIQYPEKYPPLGGLRLNDVVYGDLDEATKWFHFNKIVRSTGQTEIFDGWSSAVSETLMIVEPVAPPTEVTLKHTILVYSDGSVVIDGVSYP